MSKYIKLLVLFAVSASPHLGLGGCGGGSCPEITLAGDVCSLTGTFSLTIDNPYLPMAVGQVSTLEGTESDGTVLRIVITILDETEEVAGMTTRVLEEREFEDGELIEVSRNFFAQASDGTVCYFGEEVDDYEDGEIVSHGGEWLAGEGENVPGIMMPAAPEVGQVFAQEFAPNIAEDQAEILATGEAVETDAGTFTDTISMEDCNPLEGAAQDDKIYARNVGLIVDEVARLTSFETADN